MFTLILPRVASRVNCRNVEKIFGVVGEGKVVGSFERSVRHCDIDPYPPFGGPWTRSECACAFVCLCECVRERDIVCVCGCACDYIHFVKPLHSFREATAKQPSEHYTSGSGRLADTPSLTLSPLHEHPPARRKTNISSTQKQPVGNMAGLFIFTQCYIEYWWALSAYESFWYCVRSFWVF